MTTMAGFFSAILWRHCSYPTPCAQSPHGQGIIEQLTGFATAAPGEKTRCWPMLHKYCGVKVLCGPLAGWPVVLVWINLLGSGEGRPCAPFRRDCSGNFSSGCGSDISRHLLPNAKRRGNYRKAPTVRMNSSERSIISLWRMRQNTSILFRERFSHPRCWWRQGRYAVDTARFVP